MRMAAGVWGGDDGDDNEGGVMVGCGGEAAGGGGGAWRRKAQQIKTTLYDGSVISCQHDAMPVIDDEETLILEEINFGKCFVPQQELSAEQAFWLQTSNPNTEQSDISARIEAPSKLHKITPDAITEGE
ncbi:hypothetical protein Tco_0812734 [Tanacetum coccineum]